MAFPALSSSAPDGLRKPLAEITLGSASAEEVAKHLLRCEVQCGLLPQVDRVRITLASAGPAPALDDTAQLALGYADAGTTTVFNGQVVSITDGVDGVRSVVIGNGGTRLARARANASYEQQTAGDVVSALLSLAGVDSGTLEPGIEYAFLALDDRSSLLDHIARLARRSGLLAYLSVDDALELRAPPRTQPVQSFSYGVDVLSLSMTAAPAALGTINAIGEGAAGSEGEEAASWLLKDPAPMTVSAGQGDPERWVTDAALRTTQAVQTAADGALALAALRQLTLDLLAPGAPDVHVGAVIELGQAPLAAYNGQAFVTALRHRFDKHAGFTTRMRLARLP